MSRGTQVHAVRVPPELWERARVAATERGETVSDVMRRALSGDMTDAEVTLSMALINAIEGMREMIDYVSPHFREKYDYDGYIQRASDAFDSALPR